ncbi:quinolinate synthase NadA, partial [Desulfovibrio sp.]
MSRFSDAITAIKQGLGDRLCIMGHHYQHDDVVRHCDVTGDSLELARRIEGIDAEHIVFC